MNKASKILMVVLGAILAIVIIIYMGSANHEEHEAKKAIVEHAQEDTEHVEQKTVIKTVYVHEEEFDEYDPYLSDVETTQSSYWYVYYQFNNDHEGYKIVEIDVPYFDLNKVHKKIKPNATDEDFLGIKYFKRVSFDTYREYKKI